MTCQWPKLAARRRGSETAASRTPLAIASVAGLLLSATTLAGDCRAATDPYRIMAVGDSITAGYEDNPTWNLPYSGGYREPLHARLAAAAAAGTGPTFTFVGGSLQPLDGTFGRVKHTSAAATNLAAVGEDRHEGYGGVRTGFIAAHMAGWLAADRPDVILLMAGINDIRRGTAADPAAAEANLDAIVGTIVTTQPDARLIVAQITPYAKPTPAIQQYNAHVRALVAGYAAKGNRVSTVDQYANFLVAGDTSGARVDATLYANGINHPTAVGYDRMAATWAAGIKQLDLPPAGPMPTTANLVVNPSFESGVRGQDDHVVAPPGRGWTFTAGDAGSGIDIEPKGTYGAAAENFSAHTGGRMAFLRGSGGGTVTRLAQVVSGFAVGRRYAVEFYAKGIKGPAGADPFSVAVVDGATRSVLSRGPLSPPPSGTDGNGYTRYAFEFAASGRSETLEFYDADRPASTGESWVDDVSVTIARP